MIRPQVRSQIRPPILPQRQVLAQAVSRYFTRPDASAAQYYELSSSVVVSGDFEIEFKASTVGTPYAPFLGSELNLDNYCDLNPVNQPRIKINGNIYQATQSVPVWILDTFIFRRLDNVLYISTASGVAYSTQCSTDDFVFNLIGRRFGSTFMSGIISDIKAWSGGDRNTGDFIVDFPINQKIPTDGIIPNRSAGNPGAVSHLMAVNLLPLDSVRYEKTGNDWYGPELLDFGDWVFGSYSTYSAIDGVIYIDTIGAGVESVVIHSPLGLISKFKTYLVEYDVISTDGSIRINHNADGQTNEVANPSEGRRIVEVVGNGLGDGRIQVRVAANTVAKIRISNFSIREILRTAS